MNDADVARIRSVLDRLVESDEDELARITLVGEETFILRSIAEFDEEDGRQEERDLVGAWSGSIVAVQNLSGDRRKFFVPGSGIVFYGSEVTGIEDELTGEILFSRVPGKF